MLETRELYKVYKPKKGVAVTALNRVSLKFPDKGMVFLLGKSGSGKSTMLNLLGGLDKYDDGEIIIKGVSSKDFDQQHFDSYRNTYVGFIFQEYNILDEFSVGANIALALELQGKKATDEEINEILKEVDLEGYGNRKPNELSGGQKQRVAIARALVKNPEIIMADEPTGALDSNTGRQVFDTLKKLSKDKLVIIVSHDREFSELYADRIIELADGNVISDMELSEAPSMNENEKINYKGDMITLAPGYHLTEEDRIAINAYIEKMTDQNLCLKLTGINQTERNFVPTDESKIKKQDSSTFQLIKSKLPFKSAFKIGVSGLKYKKFRLVITILLSCISFGLFGLADTFGSYDHIKACTNSLIDSDVDYVSVSKAVKVDDGLSEYYDSYNRYLTDEDIEKLKKNMGYDFTGVYTPIGDSMSFYMNIDQETKFTDSDYNIYATDFNGFAEITQKNLDDFGYKIVAGNLPDGSKNEIAISKYVYETFHLGKYTDGTLNAHGVENYEEIQYFSDIIGKTLELNNETYTITAVIDTNFDLERYKSLTEEKERTTTSEQLVDFALMNEFSYETQYSLADAAMVGEGHVTAIKEKEPDIKPLADVYLYCYSENAYIDPMYMCQLSDLNGQNIIWLDGEKTELGEKEILVSEDVLEFYESETGSLDYSDKNDQSKIKNENFTITIYDYNDYDEFSGYKIVGIVGENKDGVSAYQTIVAGSQLYNKCILTENGDYTFAVCPMPEGKEKIQDMVSFCYSEDSDVQYQLQNAVTYELDAINSVLKTLSKIFLYIGIGFALFASLMLANFIGTSIAHKKQEIGILRAIGSRSSDVFRIFFSESFVIAMINFLLSAVGVFIATTIINSTIRKELGVLITVLNFGPRQILLLLVVSMLVAALASFLPVKKIASKRPIDAIRNR